MAVAADPKSRTPAAEAVVAPDRAKEVRELLALSTDELLARAGGRLVVTDTVEALYDYLAEEMVAEFGRAAAGRETVSFIMPVGPVQPYRRMAELVNLRGVPLKNVRFFFMDDYCDDHDRLLPESHPLSFRGQMRGLFFDRVRPELLMPPEQVVFPDPDNVDRLAGMIEAAGGIEVCYGGIGIHGHVAFNEPQPGVARTDPRICDINEFTRTIDSTRHKGLGGNLVNFPRRAVTLGMRQCLGARRLLLMTRNETAELQWANTVVRIAAAGEPGDDYPVTHTRRHPRCTIATDRATATAPRINL